MPHPAIQVVEEVCNDSDGNGIYSVGANAALRAMSHHWADHLGQGHHGPAIIVEDINGLIDQLKAMRSALSYRLPR